MANLLHEYGVDASDEAVRFWWHRFWPVFAAETWKRRIDGIRLGRWRCPVDENFVKINGEMQYLWRAVDYEGEMRESLVTKAHDEKAGLTFLRKALLKHGKLAVIVTDRLRSQSAALL